MSDNYEDMVPLANVTVAGVKEKPKSVSIKQGSEPSSPVKWNLDHGVLYITGLDKKFKGGAWAQNFSIALQN